MIDGIPSYTPSDWHWYVADVGRYWSTAAQAYSDTAPQFFTTLSTEAALRDVLAAAGVPDLAPSTLMSAAELKAHAADRRWRKEIGGTTVGGTAIQTDDRAKVLLVGAALSMADEATAPFVLGGASVTLTGAQFKALYAGLVAHVQACFATQTAVLAAIEAGSITTRAEIDAAFA